MKGLNSGGSRLAAARRAGLFFVLAMLPTLPASAAPTTSPVGVYPADVRPLLEENCFSCHGPKKQKGDINFANITSRATVLRSRKLWKSAAEQLTSEEMPPEEAKHQPAAAERAKLVEWMKHVAEVDPSDPANHDPGPPVLRRLTVAEYNHSMRDLLGIDFDVSQAVGMPADTFALGFNNLAAGLDVSSPLFEKYLAGADRALERVFATADPKLAHVQLDNNAKQKSKQWYPKVVFVTPAGGVGPHDAAKQVIERFARRAYRRPVSAEEIGRLMKLFDSLTARGEAYETAVRMTLKPVLVSPNFLFRVERDRPAQEPNGAARVSDHELAVRLSYFLWSTMPDDELSALADQGKLSDPTTLDAQVARMLADPRGRALTDNFGEQWLQLGKLASARPSTEFFPAFTYNLRRAMHDEASTFLDKLREEDHSLLDLLDSDYTYVNEELARYYGIPGIKGQKPQRVALKPEYHRGGLLGMAAVLALTSHTSRTSPTLRGKYVLDVIFGDPPPPPPANVAQIQDSRDKKAPRSFREQLAQHAGDANCAGCHRKMDPLGFALDNYDAIGTWRTDLGGRPLDTAGILPTGEKFNGVSELKGIIHKRQDEFVRNVTAQMLTYALGRQLDYFDDGVVQLIQSDLTKNGYRFSVVINSVVKSYPFQNRRPMGSNGE